MRLTFLGVRGSTPADGPDFLRFGGRTSCVAVAAGRHSPPELVLDAGTGIRALGPLLDAPAFRGTILLTHLHWDHVMGLPFSPPLDQPESSVDLWLPAQDGRAADELLRQLMSPPLFPIGPEGLNGTWHFHTAEPGPVLVENTTSAWEVAALEIVHKGGRTFGYVVGLGGVRVAYLSDHAPALGISDAALSALQGVDVLIHDAQMVESERSFANQYGHATIGDAESLAERVSARQLIMFHHAPSRTDDQIDALASTSSSDVIWAHQGMVLDVG